MSPQTGSLAQAGRCEWLNMVLAEGGGDTAGAVRVMLTPGSEAQEGNDGREMVGAICSPASGWLLPHVSMVLSVQCAFTFRKSR